LEEELIGYAAYTESHFNHPIATSILKAYGNEIDKKEISNYNEISGHGIKAIVKGKEVLAGNVKLMKKENIKYNAVDEAGTVVHIAIDS